MIFPLRLRRGLNDRLRLVGRRGCEVRVQLKAGYHRDDGGNEENGGETELTI